MGQQHEPTDENRTKVEHFKIAGLNNDEIAAQLGIDRKTLAKYYEINLTHGRNNMKGAILGALMKKVRAGDTASIIFASKTIVGLKETQVQEFVAPTMVIKPPSGEAVPMPPIHKSVKAVE